MEKEYIFAIIVVVVLALVAYWYFYMRTPPPLPDNTGINDVALSSQLSNILADIERERPESLQRDISRMKVVQSLPELLNGKEDFPGGTAHVSKPYGTLNAKAIKNATSEDMIVQIKLHPGSSDASSLKMLSALPMMPQTLKLLRDNSFLPNLVAYDTKVAELKSKITDLAQLDIEIAKLDQPVEINDRIGGFITFISLIALTKVLPADKISGYEEIYINLFRRIGAEEGVMIYAR